MIPNDIEQRKKVIQYMLDACDTASSNDELTEWESNFIQSVREQFSIHMNLSNRQCEILEKIYDKI
jgi:hypothetical protein